MSLKGRGPIRDSSSFDTIPSCESFFALRDDTNID